MSEDGGFNELKGKILYLLERYGDQLESLQKDVFKIQTDVALLSADAHDKKKTASQFFGEVLKMVSAIVTAYLLFKFGLA